MTIETSRRDFMTLMTAILAAGAAGVGGATSWPLNHAAAANLSQHAMSNALLDHLKQLETAVDQLASTWKPDDPTYRADLYRQIMMHLAFGYFVYFHADAEHPDWGPLYNPVFSCQPNPDDIYLFAPIRDDLTYRVSGHRGTVSKLIFVTQAGIPGTAGHIDAFSAFNNVDEQDLVVGDDGQLDVIFSAVRPPQYTGNWVELKPGSNVLICRYRMIDWENERDPTLSIECLDPVPPKPRLTPEQIVERIELMAQVPANNAQLFFGMQNDIRSAVGINTFAMTKLPGLERQAYWPAVFQLQADEALIIETEMPRTRPYWNIQLNDPYFNAVEYVYRFGSLNESTAVLSADGRLRAVIAQRDPGVPNWLDPAGFGEGTIYGRWYDCDSTPLPAIKRVPLAELRNHLPADTPTVTAAERDQQLRRRVRAAQRRRRW